MPTGDKHEQELLAMSSAPPEMVDVGAAHSRLLDPIDPTYEIRIYLEHPLTVRYASPHTEAQVWLTEDRSEVIISEHCVASGDFQVDIDNFFAYRRVLLCMSEILNTLCIAWGDTADTWPMERTADPASLHDENEMWANFATGLQPSLGIVRMPPQVRAMFSQKFMQATMSQWATPGRPPAG